MPNTNQVVLAGHIGGDPDVKVTQTGKQVARLSVAWNPPPKKDGEKTAPHWFYVEAWGHMAEMAKDLHKGSGVVVTGRMWLDRWNDKTTGKERTSVKVMADSLYVWPSKTAQEKPATGSVAPATEPPEDDPPF